MEVVGTSPRSSSTPCGLSHSGPHVSHTHPLPLPVPQPLHATTITTPRTNTMPVTALPDLTTCGKMEEAEAAALSEKYKGVLYLATDNGADKGVEPNGFASLQGLAARHVPVDVKVRKEERVRVEMCVKRKDICPTEMRSIYVGEARHTPSSLCDQQVCAQEESVAERQLLLVACLLRSNGIEGLRSRK